jgi:flavodoxin I
MRVYQSRVKFEGNAMAKIGLFFGSSTGKTEAVAYQIKAEFDKVQPDVVEVHNIGSSAPDVLLKYSHLIFGIPTWNTGELQDDWDVFWPRLREMDFNGKKVALFGLGDQNGYGFNFLDALGMLADEVLMQGGDVLGLWPSKTYEFNESKAKVEDHFIGLAIDEDGQFALIHLLVEQRVKAY